MGQKHRPLQDQMGHKHDLQTTELQVDQRHIFHNMLWLNNCCTIIHWQQMHLNQVSITETQTNDLQHQSLLNHT